jgi:hypothetical protein
MRSLLRLLVAAALLSAVVLPPRKGLGQGAPMSGTALVTASPNPSSTTVGSLVQVTVRVGLTGLTGKASSGGNTLAVLGGYQIAVAFDKTRLRFDSAAGGISTGYTSVPTFTSPAIANAAGSVALVASQTSPTAPTGEVTVAVLSFTALAPGTASLTAISNSLVSALQMGPPPVGPTAVQGSGVATSVTITAGPPPPTPTPGPTLHFFSLAPCRLVDTRNPAGVHGGPALVGGAIRTFDVSGGCSVPDSAKALVVNVTVTGPTAAGDLRFFPAGSPLPLASVIAYRAGQTRAVNAVVGLGPTGAFTVRCDQASGTTQLVLDVSGYFE